MFEFVLFLALFGHKHGPTSAEKERAALVEQDRQIVKNGIVGAKAFEEDVMYAQYEYPEISAFEQQIFKCTIDSDDQLDPDVDILIELGNELMALDKSLHHKLII